MNVGVGRGELPSRIRPAVDVLKEAVSYARQTSSDLWEFSVEIDQLQQLGLTPNDFRWLVRMGWAEHKREVTLDGDNGRSFRSAGDMCFSDRTCFVLTREAIEATTHLPWRCTHSCAEQLAHGSADELNADELNADELNADELNDEQRDAEAHLGDESGRGENHGDPDAKSSRSVVNRRLDQPATEFSKQQVSKQQVSKSPLPRWDRERRELTVNGCVVKHFKWTAVNQEAILSAFEEEDWPYRIDDPLSPQPGQDSKRRLGDTIKCLNRKQKEALIHFRGDGTGEGIVWEFVEQS